MLTDREKREIEARIDRELAEFEVLSWEIMYAGLAVPPDIMTNPFLILSDNSGQPWKKQAHEMGAADVVEFINHRYGPLYVEFLRNHFNGMTTH